MQNFLSSVFGWIPAPLLYVGADALTEMKAAGSGGNNGQTGESRIPMAVFFYASFIPVILSLITSFRLKYYQSKLEKKEPRFHTGFTTVFI